MELTLAYGGGQRKIGLPDGTRLDRFHPATVDRPVTCEDFDQHLRAANATDIFAHTAPLIVINDSYRSTPTARILDWLDRFDPGLLERSHFLIATGTHPAPTDTQLVDIFGDLSQRVESRVACHNCDDNASMELIGRDKFGGQVWINRLLLQAQQVLLISSVEPHYFAGFTGGRKSLFPGLTDRATIERNHNLANSLECAPLRLTGNPMAEHLDELTALIDTSRFFSVQAVLDRTGSIASIHCGTVLNSFADATESARRVFSGLAETEYDVVICEILPPLDSNLYQVQKALENNWQIVRKGGAIVLVSPCREGIGSKHFYELATEWDRDRNCAWDGVAHFGSHKLSRVIEIGRKVDVYLHSELPDSTVRRVFYEPLDKIEKLLFTRSMKNSEFRAAVVCDAGNMVLKIRKPI